MDSQEKKRYCCCFKRKRSFFACILVILVLLITIALLVFFLFPRKPEIYFRMPENAINDIALKSGNSSVLDSSALINALSNASTVSPFKLEMNISYELTVYSPNYYDIQIKSIVTKLELLDSNNRPIGDSSSFLTGTSEILNQNFQRMGNTTVNPVRTFYF